jgi:hypothetical protein
MSGGQESRDRRSPASASRRGKQSTRRPSAPPDDQQHELDARGQVGRDEVAEGGRREHDQQRAAQAGPPVWAHHDMSPAAKELRARGRRVSRSSRAGICAHWLAPADRACTAHLIAPPNFVDPRALCGRLGCLCARRERFQGGHAALVVLRLDGAEAPGHPVRQAGRLQRQRLPVGLLPRGSSRVRGAAGLCLVDPQGQQRRVVPAGMAHEGESSITSRVRLQDLGLRHQAEHGIRCSSSARARMRRS